MQARLSAFLIWALVAAGVAFWGLRLLVRPAAMPAHALTVDSQAVAGGDLVRMFGATPAVEAAAPLPIAESSRFKLLGVLAPAGPEASRSHAPVGVALIAVDGKPAKPYAVGAALDSNLVLQSVARRSASIGPAGAAASVVLELPPPAPPATATLPVATPDAAPATAPRHVQAPPQPAAEGAEPPAVVTAPGGPAPGGEGPRNPGLR